MDPKHYIRVPQSCCADHHSGSSMHRAPVEGLKGCSPRHMLDESVVLLSCGVVQRLEPVGVVGRSALDSPDFHTLGNLTCNATVDTFATLNCLNHTLIDILREVLSHLTTAENICSKVVGDSVAWWCRGESLAVACLIECFKS
mgnify:CR=1 FL=1